VPRISPAVARTIIVIGALVVCEIMTQLSSASRILVAPPSDIFWQLIKIVAATSDVPNFYANIWITIQEVIGAFAVTAVLGIALGFLFASSKLIGDAFEPILLVLYAVPKVILFPLFVLILGIGMTPKIIFGITIAIFVVIFNTSAAVRQIDPNYVRLAQSLGYGRLMTFLKVIIPATAPTILAGLRLGFGYTVIGVLAAELLVVTNGLGSLIDWASFNYFTPQLYALIIIALMIGVVGNSIFSALERRWVK
jgi:ABC-type nitrate/sulfonate/bicarbonate transport system permease component